MVDMMMNYPVLAPRNAGVFPGECETPERFPPKERGPHTPSRGALKRMNFEVYRREPTGKEYHTGLHPAGRESATRQCVVKEKTRGIEERLRGAIRTQAEVPRAGEERGGI
jgi:hypothetical protein